MTDQLMIGLTRTEDKRVWREAKQAVAQTLDEDAEDLTRRDIAREVCEAYCGRDSLGRWRENGEKA